MIKLAPWILGAVIVVVGSIMVHDILYPKPKIILRYDQVQAQSRYDVSKVAQARTRYVQVGDIKSWEVELPSGVWVGCGGDCQEALRQKHLDFFETIQEESR